MTLAETLAQLEKFERLADAMKEADPELVEKLTGIALGLGYGFGKEDKTRIITMKAALDTLAAMEDSLVEASVSGPYSLAIKQASAPAKAAVELAKQAWSLASEDWDAAVDAWNAIPGGTIQKIGGVIASLGESLKKKVKLAKKVATHPIESVATLFVATVATLTVTTVAAQLAKVKAAHAEWERVMRSRALPQRKVHRIQVLRRTRN